MATSIVISLGIGSPSGVEHLVTLGLEAGDVLLVGGETGYGYTPSTSAPGTPSILVATPAAAAPTYTYGS